MTTSGIYNAVNELFKHININICFIAIFKIHFNFISHNLLIKNKFRIYLII